MKKIVITISAIILFFFILLLIFLKKPEEPKETFKGPVGAPSVRGPYWPPPTE
ncbi:MAG: hypothetical protein WC842_02060 [Candidatus Paceibacterota bacterium]|jgi:hypothetical protein